MPRATIANLKGFTEVSKGVFERTKTAKKPDIGIPTSAKRTKYGNRKCELDGFVFDSEKEMGRYVELKHSEWSCEIKDLELQPKFPLMVNGIKIASYIADFRYKRLTTRKAMGRCS